MAFDPSRAEALQEQARQILLKNRRTTDGHQYTVPSPVSYPYQWLWDSCFHAFALKHLNTEDAKKELRSILSKQFENGMIPHMIYWEDGKAIDIKWGKDHTSSITQPPLIAQVAWEIFEKDGDEAFLKEIYSKLYHYYNYLLSERDPRRHHLVGIINPDESGEDSSPRFDSVQGLPAKHSPEENLHKRVSLVEKLQSCNFDAPFCMKSFFWVKDVPFNAIIVTSLQALAKISDRLNYYEEALYFSEQALQVTRAMRDRMLENGIFWSLSGENYEKIHTKTWAIFMPLYAHLISKDEAEALVKEHLANPHEFKTLFGIPTVSLDEPSYEPQGPEHDQETQWWRGPVWIAPNWFIYRGLRDYGFDAEADELLEQTATLLETSGFREQYHPETGAGQGAEQFTWGALIVDMLAYQPRAVE